MREPHVPGPMPPRDWSEAFAALPPETPPADALSPVFAQLPTSSRSRFHTSWWIAAAAAIALVAIVPLAMKVARHSGASRSPAVAIQKPELGPGLRRDDGVESVAVRSDVATPVTAPGQQTLGPGLRRDDGGKNPATDATGPAQQQIAKADPPRRKPHRANHVKPTTDATDKAMEPLYAESARLEALLALARDDRAASATAVALGSDFEARVAGIDATLAQPSLTAQRRLDLWRERVSALRAYASFESTQRALAASGERYDAMLVSID